MWWHYLQFLEFVKGKRHGRFRVLIEVFPISHTNSKYKRSFMASFIKGGSIQTRICKWRRFRRFHMLILRIKKQLLLRRVRRSRQLQKILQNKRSRLGLLWHAWLWWHYLEFLEFSKRKWHGGFRLLVESFVQPDSYFEHKRSFMVTNQQAAKNKARATARRRLSQLLMRIQLTIEQRILRRVRRSRKLQKTLHFARGCEGLLRNWRVWRRYMEFVECGQRKRYGQLWLLTQKLFQSYSNLHHTGNFLASWQQKAKKSLSCLVFRVRV